MKAKNDASVYPNITAHNLVAEVAVGLAQEVYEESCGGNNAVYKVIGGDRDDFIRHCAPRMVAAARVVLAQMLTQSWVSDAEKEQIHEALVYDNMLPSSGVSAVKVH